jgi:hypothetical protein
MLVSVAETFGKAIVESDQSKSIVNSFVRQ